MVKTNKQPRRPRRQRATRQRTSQLARADPPAILPEPYSALVVEANWQGSSGQDFIMTLSSLNDLILEQLGISLTTGTNLAFRILEIGVWEVTGKGVEAAFHDLDDKNTVDADYAPLTTKLDTPGRNRWAHVHFRYPPDNRNNALRAVGEPANFQFLSIRPGFESSGDARVKALIRVSWRTSKAANPGRSRALPVGRDVLPARDDPLASRLSHAMKF